MFFEAVAYDFISKPIGAEDLIFRVERFFI